MRAAKHAPRDPFIVLERSHGLTQIVKRGGVVLHAETLRQANNYAGALLRLKRFKETKKLLRKTVPVARRVLGDSNDTTLRMRANYNVALVNANCSTLDDIREAMTMLEDLTRITRRVFGSAHPLVALCEDSLRLVRKKLGASETPSASAESSK